MAAGPIPAATLAGLLVYLATLLAQRLGELLLSRRNLARLAARGAIEAHAGHFWMFVVLHTGYPFALAAEVVGGAARPPATWPLWLAVWLAAQVLRITAIATLGERW